MIPSLPGVARITATSQESSQVRTLVLDLHLEAEPGQFVMAWLPGVNEKPFSLVRADPVTLTIARVGPFSAALHTLQVGDRLWIRGPLGRPFTLPDSKKEEKGSKKQEAGILPPVPCILLIGGGYGVAPLHFLAERALTAGWGVSVVIGARTAEGVILADRFTALGAQAVIATDDGSLGLRGLATDAAAYLLDQGEYAGLYACGPEPMLDAVEALARAHHLPAQLSYEGLMRCGFGVCGSCARGGWLVCRDGPVRQVAGGESQGANSVPASTPMRIVSSGKTLL